MSVPLIIVLLGVGAYVLFIQPERQRQEAYKQNVFGFIAAVSVQIGGIYVGDVYSMVAAEIDRRKKAKEGLPDFTVFALDMLYAYASKTDYPTLSEFCEQHRREASRFRVEYDLVP